MMSVATSNCDGFWPFWMPVKLKKYAIVVRQKKMVVAIQYLVIVGEGLKI